MNFISVNFQVKNIYSKKISLHNVSLGSDYDCQSPSSVNPVDTGRKLNVHKRFRRRPERRES